MKYDGSGYSNPPLSARIKNPLIFSGFFYACHATGVPDLFLPSVQDPETHNEPMEFAEAGLTLYSPELPI
jgi:hypothetical protein